MALAIQEQLKRSISESKNILIAFKKNYTPDTLASGIALKLLLEKLGKHADVVSDNFNIEEKYAFLPKVECVNKKMDGVKQVKICVDLANNSLKDFSYNIEDGKLNIMLTPKEGMIKKDHLSLHEGAYKYDLIITLDTEDLESLGSIYTDYQDFFYDTTIINIDHKSENEHYGQINHIDLNVTSIAEVIFNLFNELYPDKQLFDEHIAQCLLCGLISKTNSFKSNKVTPVTLHIASQLMQLGADRDKIVKNLYYTKSVSVLKLWGKILARLKSDFFSKITWSYITQDDFNELKTSPEHIHDLIDELILTAPEAKIIVIYYQYNNHINGIIHTDPSNNAKLLVNDFNPIGSSRRASFTSSLPDLNQVINEITEYIQQRIKK